MQKSQGEPVSVPAAAGQVKKPVVAGLAILAGVVLIIAGICISVHRNKKVSEAPVRQPVAELVSAGGLILVNNPGNPEWREVKTGARFNEGDLVRTDSAGEAVIRYMNGAAVLIPPNTVMKVRKSADNEMEISASPDATGTPLLFVDENGNPAKETGKGPFIELQQIIQFGKSLELIGRVETGSSLLINDEIVEVSGEGQFKHFTKPFAVGAEVVRLNLKVTDLAGRTRKYTAVHDFRPSGGGN
jgi:hypothetical protein